MSGTQSTPFGRALRQWRRLRGVSQLALAATAATTTRHVSYLETGRSRPSREMVDRLGDALEVPLRERNRMLELAGLAGVYPEGDLAADDLIPFRRVVDRLLRTHQPYPAFVVDRHWNVVDANRAAQRFLPDARGPNTARLLLDAWRPLIENWDEVAVAVVDRIGWRILAAAPLALFTASLSAYRTIGILGVVYAAATAVWWLKRAWLLTQPPAPAAGMPR